MKDETALNYYYYGREPGFDAFQYYDGKEMDKRDGKFIMGDWRISGKRP